MSQPYSSRHSSREFAEHDDDDEHDQFPQRGYAGQADEVERRSGPVGIPGFGRGQTNNDPFYNHGARVPRARNSLLSGSGAPSDRTAPPAYRSAVSSRTSTAAAPSYESRQYSAEAGRGTRGGSNVPPYSMTGGRARPANSTSMYDERDPYQYSRPIQGALTAVTGGNRARRGSRSDDSSGTEDTPAARDRRRQRRRGRQDQAATDYQRRMAEQNRYDRREGGSGGGRGAYGYGYGR